MIIPNKNNNQKTTRNICDHDISISVTYSFIVFLYFNTIKTIPTPNKIGNAKKNRSRGKDTPSNNQINNYTTNVQKLNQIVKSLTNLPNEIRDSLMTVLEQSPDARTNTHFIVSNCEVLFGYEVKALRELSILSIRKPIKRAQFLTSLTPMLRKQIPSQLKNVKQNNNNDEQYWDNNNDNWEDNNNNEDNEDNDNDDDTNDDPEFGFTNKVLFDRVLPPLLRESLNQQLVLYVLPNIL
jgi:hypothetical protein